MARVVITGAAGFIGSNFAHYMRKVHPDYELVLVDNFTYAGNFDNIRDLVRQEGVSLVIGDIARAFVNERFSLWGPVDYLVNFAAETFVDTSIHGDFQPFITSNIQGVAQLLAWARTQPQLKNYVQVSTDEVYGDLPLNTPQVFTERDPVRPNNPYAASKASADHLVQSFVRTYGVKACITRCCNNYGPRQHPEKFLPKIILKAEKGERFPLYGRGEHMREWLHVEDHCRAIDAVLHGGRPGEVYNVGGSGILSNLALADRVLRAYMLPQDHIDFVEDRPGHDLRYQVDATKLWNEFGIRPQVYFMDGLQDTIRWYQDNVEWVRRVESGSYRTWNPDYEFGVRVCRT